jgi:hypothetical protein
MALIRTREWIRDQARELADEVNSTFITNTTIDRWIDAAFTKLHDLMVSANPDWWLAEHVFQTTVGTKEYALPEDFYQARGVDLMEGAVSAGEGQLAAVGEGISIESYNFLDRNRHSQNWPPMRWIDAPAVRYRIVRSGHDPIEARIRFEPDPGGRVYRLWYVRASPSEGNTEYDGVNGWEEYVIADVAIKMMIKSESDPSAAMALKSEAEARINRMAPKRDQGRPVQVADTRRR